MSQQVANPTALDELELQITQEIDHTEGWRLLEEFSDLTRVSGTEDEQRAAEYITDRLEALGVQYDRYDPELYISQPHEGTVKTLDRDYEFGHTKTIAFSASRTVSGPVEYVGAANDDPLEGTGETEPYRDVGDLTGTIALTAAGSLSIRATRILEDKNAAGVIAIHQHEREPHDGIATPVWGGAPPLDEKSRIPDIPIVNVNKPDGEQLREWAEGDGVEVELTSDTRTGWFECPVIVAEIEAGDPVDNDDFLLLHGHYDSWHVGITDNATGDAGLLESARVFEKHADKLKRNLRVAWWPAHSTGRYAGSTWYADEFGLDLAENCVAQVNMDSPGAKDATEYTDMSCWSPEAHPHVAEAIEDVTDAPYEEHLPHRAGDYSFDNLGISGFFMLSSNIPTEEREERGYHEVGGCGGNSDAWHLTTDTLDKAGKDEFVRDIQLYAVSVLRVLNADILPLDHARNARKLLETTEEYDSVAGDDFDFEPTREELSTLIEDLEQFYDAAHSGDIKSDVANETIKKLSRVLTRLMLVTEDQFDQDPAIGRDPLPRYAPANKFPILEGDDRRFLQVQLKREQNEVLNDIRRARNFLP